MDKNPINPIPPTLQNLYADLDFLSQIKRGLKPCCSTKVLSEQNWSGTLYRTWKYWTIGECKEKVVENIEQIIRTAVEAITNQRYAEHLKLTINYLDKARPGIDSLTHTYGNHPSIKARINVVLQDIDIQLKRYSKLIDKNTPELEDTNDLSDKDKDKDNKEVKEVKEVKELKNDKEINPFQPDTSSLNSSLPPTPIVLSDSTESVYQSSEKKNFSTKKFNKAKNL